VTGPIRNFNFEIDLVQRLFAIARLTLKAAFRFWLV